MSKIAASITLALGVCLLWATSVRAEGTEGHPHMHASLAELKEARRELKEAAHDFGGHRAEALKAVDAAIKQMRQALEVAPGGVPAKAVAPAAPPVEAGVKHPHIRAALAELKGAQTELKEAAHDFGGHRAEALEAVDAAIKHLTFALEYKER